MTPRELALRVLKTSGIVSLDPTIEENSLNRRGITTGDLEDVLAVMNAAAQEICSEGPAALTEKTVNEVLRAPVSLSIVATQYSKAVTVTGYQAWMEGCTVRLSGDDQDNRFVSGTELLAPYMAASGTVAATVYGDTLALDENVLNIIEPVELSYRRLAIAADPQTFLSFPQRAGGEPYATEQGSRWFGSKAVAAPMIAWCDQEWDDSTGYLPIFLRFNPMPEKAYSVRFRVKRKPKPFVLADIDSGDHTTDPNTVIPADWIEAILLPVVMQRWTAHPSYNGDGGKLTEIRRQYDQAIAMLQKMVPRTGSSKATYI